MDDMAHPSLDWRSLAESVPGGIAIQQDGRFVYVSDEASSILGPKNTLQGESWRRLFDEPEAKFIEEEALETARTDGHWEGVVHTSECSTDGVSIDLALSTADPDSHVWAFSSRTGGNSGRSDRERTSGRRPPEDADIVWELLDGLEDILYVVDEDGESVLWNQKLVETTGYDHDEIDSMHFTDFIPEDQRGSMPELLDAMDDVEDRRVEVDLLTKGGDRIPHEVTGTTYQESETGQVFQCALARDVTARLAHERELERYETIVETVTDGVYALDEDLQFTFVNEGLCEMFGRSRDDLLGTRVLELSQDNEEIAIAAEERERVVDSDNGIGTIEGTIQTPQGDRHLETRFRLHPSSDDEFSGSVGVIRDVTELRQLRRELEEEHRFVQNIVDVLDDVLYVIDEAGNFVFWNNEATERFGYSDDEMAELNPREFVRPEELDGLPLDPVDLFEMPDRRNLDLVTKDGEAIPHEVHGVNYTDEETGKRYRVGVARDIADRLRRERVLERHRDELSTLDRINELLMETARELIQTASRDAVEEIVCERLAASDLYQFAWVGERELDGDRVVTRTSCGEDGEFLDEITITLEGDEVDHGPVSQAITSGEVQVANVDDPEGNHRCEWKEPHDIESMVAVPLVHEETVYGVLVVYATRKDAFSDREQAGFDVVGRTVGFVIHAHRNRELLFADSVNELEFHAPTADSVVGRTAIELNCDIDLDGYVASGDRWILYLNVSGASPHEVVAAVDNDPAVASARVVSGTDEEGRIEMIAKTSSVIHTADAAGASIQNVRANPEGVHFVIDVPVDADVREVVEFVTEAYPNAELVAQRERDHEVTSMGRPASILEKLTDRQREVLTAAYQSGYYDWPRKSTADAVADSVDLAPSTLHGHLRKAERTILTRAFDTEHPNR